MKITRILATFKVKKMTELQKHVYEFEAAFGKFFKTPFRITNVDDSAPDEIIRFMAQPKEGFALRATATDMVIEWANIPPSFDDSIVLDKIGDIVSEVGSFLENYIDEAYNFFGLQVFMRLEQEEIGMEPSIYMIKKAGGSKTGNVIDHIEVKASYIEPPYFINTSISNASPMQITGEKYAKPTNVLKGKEFLAFMMDINDKYGFFNMKEYESVVESAEGIVDKFIDFYNEKLLSFIKGEEINHFF